jgi:hypothetical protein
MMTWGLASTSLSSAGVVKPTEDARVVDVLPSLWRDTVAELIAQIRIIISKA